MKIYVSGVLFDNIDMDEAVFEAVRLIDEGSGGYIVTPNPEIVWMCRKNAALREALAGAALTLPDGVGITVGAKILGRPLKCRVPGIDFVSALFAAIAAGAGHGVFLLGSAPGVADMAADRLRDAYPGLIISGTHDGYFTDDAAVADRIDASGAALVLVCLGAPKQELWMKDNALPGRLMIGLGGALDVFSGNVKRAPAFMRSLGLEWLYRLFIQPRRILRILKLPAFIIAVLWQRIRGKSANVR